MNKIYFLFILITLLSCNQNRGDINIVEKGVSNYRIIYSEKASDTLVRAINDFRKNLRVMSGVEITSFTDIVGAQPEEILIGKSKRMDKYASIIPYTDLGLEGYFSTVKGKKWIITGNTTTAIENALYDFVEKLGAIKTNERITKYNQYKTIKVPAITTTFIPPFNYRQLVHEYAYNADYSKWNHINVNNQNDWGTWEYSMERIFPANSYFLSKPGYFAVINGKNQPNQINFGNSDLKTDLEKNLQVWTMSKGLAPYWAVSPYQNDIISQDAETQKLIAETGSASGAVLSFVNKLAVNNRNRIFAIWCGGAYRPAPKSLKPEKNVMIVLDTKDLNRAVSMADGNTNQAFRKDLADWKALTDNIMVIEYLTNNDQILMPFPNFTSIQKNLQYLQSQGIKKVSFQGASTLGTSFHEAKAYVASNLAWDPNQNLDTLIWRYCDNNYGKAARSMFGYIKALEKLIQESRSTLNIYTNPSDGSRSWLQPTNINQLYSYFNSAEPTISNDPEIKDLIAKEKLGLIYTQLEVSKANGTKTFGYFMNLNALSIMMPQENSVRKEGSVISNKSTGWTTLSGMRTLVGQFQAECGRLGITAINKAGLSPDEYINLLNKYTQQQIVNHAGMTKGSFSFSFSPDPRFADGDPSVLNDGVRGQEEYPYSNWVGFTGNDMELTYDYGKDTTLKSVETNFLQNLSARAWLPSKVSVSISADGKEFKEVKSTSFSPSTSITARQGIVASFNPQSIKAIKIKASGLKICPADHVAAGNPASIILDEVIIR